MKAEAESARLGEQLDAERDYRAWPIDEDEREFWNRPLREAIRAGNMTPLPVQMAAEAGCAKPSMLGRCHLCGNETRETKDGAQFCRACERPRPCP